MQDQITSNILMIRPVRFSYNQSTADSNAFMNKSAVSELMTNQKAQDLFDRFVDILRINEIDVHVFEDTPEPHTPDSIFPNNWISFHHSGRVVLYPMEAINRRTERRMDIIESLKKHFMVESILDFSYLENKNQFLEGTGSLVLDRMNRIAYACTSSRTNEEALKTWQQKMANYVLYTFNAFDKSNMRIYHTNVMMCIGDNFAVVCLESIKNRDERLGLIQKLSSTHKEIIEISLEQMSHFAGNMLQVKNRNGRKILVMSSQAYRSLNKHQIDSLRDKADILPVDLDEIENLGGGSARCMMAEIHLLPQT